MNICSRCFEIDVENVIELPATKTLNLMRLGDVIDVSTGGTYMRYVPTVPDSISLFVEKGRKILKT
jgi:hypothetical protein